MIEIEAGIKANMLNIHTCWFEIVTAITVQSPFHLEIHQNKVFFLKNHF